MARRRLATAGPGHLHRAGCSNAGRADQLAPGTPGVVQPDLGSGPGSAGWGRVVAWGCHLALLALQGRRRPETSAGAKPCGRRDPRQGPDVPVAHPAPLTEVPRHGDAAHRAAAV